MFSESLLETSWAERGRRSWTTLTSFAAQAVIIAGLMLIPLLMTAGPPLARTVSTPIRVTRNDPGPAPQPHDGGRAGGARIIPYTGRILEPGYLPHPRPDPGEQPMPPGAGPDIGPYLPSGPGLAIAISGTHPVIPAAPKPVETVFRKSEILQGHLLRKVEPKYPPLAMAARIQGPVVLAAVISKAGTMENLRLVSGHPMLAGAAIDAVRQWRYQPYILNGDVIEVETEITVNFVLGR
jgi:periplasmic protein TonB